MEMINFTTAIFAVTQQEGTGTLRNSDIFTRASMTYHEGAPINKRYLTLQLHRMDVNSEDRAEPSEYAPAQLSITIHGLRYLDYGRTLVISGLTCDQVQLPGDAPIIYRIPRPGQNDNTSANKDEAAANNQDSLQATNCETHVDSGILPKDTSVVIIFNTGNNSGMLKTFYRDCRTTGSENEVYCGDAIVEDFPELQDDGEKKSPQPFFCRPIDWHQRKRNATSPFSGPVAKENSEDD